MEKESVIEVENLTKDYKRGRGVFDFTFQVKKGSVFGLIGTNGSGKTTTIRHMMGFIKGDSGSVRIAGMDAWRDAAKVKRLVGYVPGQIDFPDVGTGTSFLRIQAELLGLRDFTYMNRLIDRFKIDITAPLNRMSKGMKQKMAIVAAFMAQPDIYLLDEPSTGLDPLMRDTLIELILEQKAKGKTVFMSSHVFKELEDTCDEVMFIHNGHIVNQVKRSQYESDPHETYSFTVASEEEYLSCREAMDRFIRRYQDGHMECWRRHRHRQFTVVLPTTRLNEFFALLSQFTVSKLDSERFSLEKYYTTIIERREVA
ncbi:ABC transporter ATP-binding protein [Thermophilibacter sp.]